MEDFEDFQEIFKMNNIKFTLNIYNQITGLMTF